MHYEQIHKGQGEIVMEILKVIILLVAVFLEIGNTANIYVLERLGKVRVFEIEGKLYKLTDYVYKIAARPARATPRPEESEDKE